MSSAAVETKPVVFSWVDSRGAMGMEMATESRKISQLINRFLSQADGEEGAAAKQHV